MQTVLIIVELIIAVALIIFEALNLKLLVKMIADGASGLHLDWCERVTVGAQPLLGRERVGVRSNHAELSLRIADSNESRCARSAIIS